MTVPVRDAVQQLLKSFARRVDIPPAEDRWLCCRRRPGCLRGEAGGTQPAAVRVRAAASASARQSKAENPVSCRRFASNFDDLPSDRVGPYPNGIRTVFLTPDRGKWVCSPGEAHFASISKESSRCRCAPPRTTRFPQPRAGPGKLTTRYAPVAQPVCKRGGGRDRGIVPATPLPSGPFSTRTIPGRPPLRGQKCVIMSSVIPSALPQFINVFNSSTCDRISGRKSGAA
jgi:hypothetical protein